MTPSATSAPGPFADGEAMAFDESSTRPANWVQAMEATSTRRTSPTLHRGDGTRPIPTTAHKPGYQSNAMSWKFWRPTAHRRLEDRRKLGSATAYDGHTHYAQRQHHVRVTAYALAVTDDGRVDPVQRGAQFFCGMFVADRTTRTAGANSAEPKAWRNQRETTAAENLFAIGPVPRHRAHKSTQTGYPAVFTRRRRNTAVGGGREKRALQRRGRLVSQDMNGDRSMGRSYDRSQEQLVGSTDRPSPKRHISSRRPRASPREGTPGTDRQLHHHREPRDLLEPGEAGGRSARSDDPVVREYSNATNRRQAQITTTWWLSRLISRTNNVTQTWAASSRRRPRGGTRTGRRRWLVLRRRSCPDVP